MDADFEQLRATMIAQSATDEQRLAEMRQILDQTRAQLIADGVDELALRTFEMFVAQWALIGGLDLVSREQLRFLDEYGRRHAG